ncbi:MAG: hypothetical protein HND58_01390 [Planctomycetota bacterium]|nr:MAG: hypothetical protein HND58_01390 [Planctomycetota bacterium]
MAFESEPDTIGESDTSDHHGSETVHEDFGLLVERPGGPSEMYLYVFNITATADTRAHGSSGARARSPHLPRRAGQFHHRPLDGQRRRSEARASG